MGRRNARQCRERYKNYLSPQFHNDPWTPAEERLLTEKVKELGQKWSKIATFFKGRSDVNVKNQWAAILTRQARVERAQNAKEIRVAQQTAAPEIQFGIQQLIWPEGSLVKEEEDDDREKAFPFG
jgi:hypothetical protein